MAKKKAAQKKAISAYRRMIPDEILIEGHPFVIEFSDLKKCPKRERSLYGEYDPCAGKIRLEIDDRAPRQLETLFHELCHALDDYGPMFTGHAALNYFSAALFRLMVVNRFCFDPDHYKGDK